jgi:hypothetical protein
VGQNAEPQPDLIAPEPVATQPRHLYRLLALLDPLLGLAALVIEVDDLPVRDTTELVSDHKTFALNRVHN